ncbi:MAG: phosphate ABC transporter permease PstA [Methanosarcinales archaeon]|nr:phosphate ABC transporter permease PstA [Methanosarcinales archaeon]
MRLKILEMASVGLALTLFFTSIAALVLQSGLGHLERFWDWGLLALAVLLAASAATARPWKTLGPKRASMLQADILFFPLILYLRISGLVVPDMRLQLSGLDGSFGYNLVFPFLVLLASLVAIKDALNIHYRFTTKGRQAFVFSLIRLSALLTILILGGIFFTILFKGMWALSPEFLTGPHYSLGQKGGISTCIEGTFWLIVGAMLVSAPLGIGASIYLNEYSRSIKLKRVISIAVGGLNGVPSVVYGLFGLAFLVATFGISLLAGSVILGLMNLPTIILTSQEALKSVPNSLREGSVALGASKWQTIKKVVLPSAMPGILTGLILGVARAAGETAPIMWTAVTFTAMPVQKIYGVIPDPYQPVNNLCYHLLQLIYFLGAWDVESNAWGTALVLILLVLVLNLAAIMVRNHYRKKVSW